MPLPPDYAERVYAGVLGKTIGVYLGRPFEGWTHERILAELGPIEYFVHERLGRPLVVVDDDLSGTFTFLRALVDYGASRDITPAEVGQTWLNYIIDGRSTLWWGGLGTSTEHTAYLRLAAGIPAPRSGSTALNGQVVAEQIGAQIFIDSWAMVAPGDPELAADLARRAASVSHDGAALEAAQLLAAMESLAFVENDIDALLDAGLRCIPAGSLIARLAADLREWRAEFADWRVARQHLAAHYGYDRYGGGCHVVPNQGVVLLGLLYGGGDFQRSLMIANTSGWDTDCNSGNLGCLLGLRGGLAALDAGALGAGPDWRGPVADRLLLSTADGGRSVTDAVIEAGHIVDIGRALAGLPPTAPKAGARFHFDFPGAVQGFQPDAAAGQLEIENVAGHSRKGSRSLALRYRSLAAGQAVRALTPTFVLPDPGLKTSYRLFASPTLYPGQTVRAGLAADAGNRFPVPARLFVEAYDSRDQRARLYGPETTLAPGEETELSWMVDDLDGAPIAAVGVELRGAVGAAGTVDLDTLTWDGTPTTKLVRPRSAGTAWRRAWVDAMDQLDQRDDEPLRLIQNQGTGLLLHGTREWTDYAVTATFVPQLVRAFGLAARVQGLRRYYALLLAEGNRARLVKALDGELTLSETGFPWTRDQTYELKLQVAGPRLIAFVNGQPLFDIVDEHAPLASGGVALLCTEGTVVVKATAVGPFTVGAFN
jgi:ADP-ribosylglycohydrolase